ncbi:TetR/AcrR family transcriptional regulator [Streptomyces sp. NPDC003016]
MAQRQDKKQDKKEKKARLSARDWADAALTAIGEGGLAAVAVEPLAARLGTTKGSFYWHFTNREALIEAALARWAETATEAAITEIDTEPDPASRIRRLFTEATVSAIDDPLEVSLLATASHPQVAAALKRVTERRVEYVAGLFADLGFSEPEARRRGLLAYSVYLGHSQLGHAAPSVLPEGDELGSYLESALDALMRLRPDPSGGRCPGDV